MTIALDGSVSGAIGKSVTSKSLSLTTTVSGDEIIVLVASSLHSLSAQPTNHVTSVTATGLTFTQRFAYNNRVVGSYDANVEGWGAPATGILSALSITVNMNVGPDTGVIGMFGVSGVSGYDANAAVPATSGTGQVTISTTTANDFLMFLGYDDAGVTLQPAPAGFSTLFANIADTSGLGNSHMSVYYDIVAATQSAVTLGTAADAPYVAADAYAGGGGGGSLIPPMDMRRNRTYLRR